jgi:hypothetical protein
MRPTDEQLCEELNPVKERLNEVCTWLEEVHRRSSCKSMGNLTITTTDEQLSEIKWKLSEIECGVSEVYGWLNECPVPIPTLEKS